jgi:hypothetical protein
MAEMMDSGVAKEATFVVAPAIYVAFASTTFVALAIWLTG